MTTELSRGTALLEVVILGFALFAVIAMGLTTATRLQQAGERVDEVAHYAATWGVRYGDERSSAQVARRLMPDAKVAVRQLGSTLSVEVAIEVPLLGPAGSALTYTLRGQGTAQVSQYRSDP